METEEDRIAADVHQIELLLQSTQAGENHEDGTEESACGNLIVDEQRDLELGDPLDTALAINRAYQEILKQNLAVIEELLKRNAERQAEAKLQVFCASEEKLRIMPSEVRPFHPPYFKDDMGLTHPHNTDSKCRQNLFPKIQPPVIWKVHQEDILRKSLKEQMKAKCIKDLNLRLKRLKETKIKLQNGDETEEDIRSTLDGVQKNFNMADIPVEHVIQHADWLTIANFHLEGAFSPECCMAMYKNLSNPLVNRSRFTEQEDQKILELVEQHGLHNWSLIADHLGTNRSPFLCLQRYQHALRDHRDAHWSEEQIRKLKKITHEAHGKEVVNWDKVAWLIGGVSAMECKYQYENCRGPTRKWTSDEDQRLILAMKLFKNNFSWLFVAAFVQTRQHHQCRDRWIISLDPSIERRPWSLKEDRLLFNYIRDKIRKGKINSKNDVKYLRTVIRARSGNTITQRLRTIQRKIALGEINEATFKVLGSKGKKGEMQSEPADKGETKGDGEGHATGCEKPPAPLTKEYRWRKCRHISKLQICGHHLRKRHRAPSSESEEELSILKTAKPASRPVDEALEFEKEKYLGLILTAYPQASLFSQSLLESATCSLRRVLNHPDVDVSSRDIHTVLLLRNHGFRRAVRRRSARLVEKNIVISKPKQSRKTQPDEPFILHVKEPIETFVYNTLHPRPKAQLPEEEYKHYSSLIQKALEKTDPESGALSCLPPNEITLNAYYLFHKRMETLRLIAGVKDLSKCSTNERKRLDEIKTSSAYQNFKQRFESTFLWPARLSHTDISTVRKQNVKEKINQVICDIGTKLNDCSVKPSISLAQHPKLLSLLSRGNQERSIDHNPVSRSKPPTVDLEDVGEAVDDHNPLPQPMSPAVILRDVGKIVSDRNPDSQVEPPNVDKENVGTMTNESFSVSQSMSPAVLLHDVGKTIDDHNSLPRLMSPTVILQDVGKTIDDHNSLPRSMSPTVIIKDVGKRIDDQSTLPRLKPSVALQHVEKMVNSSNPVSQLRSPALVLEDAGKDTLPSMPKMLVSVDVKVGHKKVPTDVAAIIMRSLQEKAKNPEAFRSKTKSVVATHESYMTIKKLKGAQNENFNTVDILFNPIKEQDIKKEPLVPIEKPSLPITKRQTLSSKQPADGNSSQMKKPSPLVVNKDNIKKDQKRKSQLRQMLISPDSTCTKVPSDVSQITVKSLREKAVSGENSWHEEKRKVEPAEKMADSLVISDDEDSDTSPYVLTTIVGPNQSETFCTNKMPIIIIDRSNVKPPTEKSKPQPAKSSKRTLLPQSSSVKKASHLPESGRIQGAEELGTSFGCEALEPSVKKKRLNKKQQ